MSGPTLYKKGNLVEISWQGKKIGPSQSELDDHVPLDYIMEWFAKRLPTTLHGSPSHMPKSPADRIQIIQSSTGSGKSTVFPPEFFHRFFAVTNKNICCTQPRVLTSKEIPEQILPFNTKKALQERGYKNRQQLVMGENIGYQTGVISKRPVKGIIYMTIGVLTQQLNIMSDEDFMKKYSIIFIDEAHERSVGTDTALYMLKKFIGRHYKKPECPFVVVMSATFDPFRFCDYLLDDVKAPARYENITQVRGMTYPITEHFMEYDSPNFIQNVVDRVVEIHKAGKSDFMGDTKSRSLKEDKAQDTQFRDILIFVAGASEIRKIKKKLNSLNSDDPYFQEHPILPLELSRDVVTAQSQEYKNLFRRIEDTNVQVLKNGKVSMRKPTRRVIVSTNVGETGITIDTLKYVIDTGFHKSSEFNPCFAVNLLVTKPVTQSMYIQRRGRVGRKAPGWSYAMFTKATRDLLQVDQYPDIIKDDVTLDILSLLIKEIDPDGVANEKDLYELIPSALTNADADSSEIPNVRKPSAESKAFWKKISSAKIDFTKLDLLDLPAADTIHYALDKLFNMGAIDSNSIPTPIGFIINKFRFISIESIRMILAGYAWGVSILDLITMAAFLEFRVDDIYPERSAGNYQKAQKAGKFSVFPKIADPPEHGMLKSEVLLADDFIQNLVVFAKFQEKLRELASKKIIPTFPEPLEEEESSTTGGARDEYATPPDPLQLWCEDHGLSLPGLLKVVELRDEIMDMMNLIGLNPFHNFNKSLTLLLQGTDQQKFEHICNMKRCIFEGYKMNIASWNNVEKTFITRKTHLQLKGLDIKFGSDFTPRYVIISDLLYQLNTKTMLYDGRAGFVSVLDGYITLDTNFDVIVEPI